ncbi:hypothetical protein HanPSC8_Chr04g0180031 [Helianthus annuus]|nr:hypothetical protein HanPSC8_Chr04g0180031 [Helianthus annuus]
MYIYTHTHHILDPTKELSRLVYEHKYEEAFTAALQRSDVRIVSWLCSQGLLARNHLPLSQGELLFLLQQLACDSGCAVVVSGWEWVMADGGGRWR